MLGSAERLTWIKLVSKKIKRVFVKLSASQFFYG